MTYIHDIHDITYMCTCWYRVIQYLYIIEPCHLQVPTILKDIKRYKLKLFTPIYRLETLPYQLFSSIPIVPKTLHTFLFCFTHQTRIQQMVTMNHISLTQSMGLHIFYCSTTRFVPVHISQRSQAIHLMFHFIY